METSENIHTKGEGCHYNITLTIVCRYPHLVTFAVNDHFHMEQLLISSKVYRQRLPYLNQAQHHEGIWRSRGVAPYFLNLNTR
jgi:hypothetical protein